MQIKKSLNDYLIIGEADLGGGIIFEKNTANC